MRKCQIFQNTKEGAPELGSAGAPILEVDGLLFKDLAGTGELLPYEDWRLDAKTRAKDLASRLSVEEIAVSCGYRNSLAFGKIFKQKVGITPTQYRNDNRKDARERLIRAQNELKEYKKHKTIYVGNIEKE
mgnify:CR=1 FL=1